MTSRHAILRAATALACLALASAPHLAHAQEATGEATGEARSPAAGGLGVVLALAGAPFLVAGSTLLASGVARDEPRHREAIDDLQTSGGFLLLGTGGILLGAGIPTIAWGFGSDSERPSSGAAQPRARTGSAAPSVVVAPSGAAAAWRF